MNEIKRS